MAFIEIYLSAVIVVVAACTCEKKHTQVLELLTETHIDHTGEGYNGFWCILESPGGRFNNSSQKSLNGIETVPQSIAAGLNNRLCFFVIL